MHCLSNKLIATFFALALLAMATPLVQATPSVGEPAPEFTGTDSNGVSHKLSDFRGSNVVLEWTNHECPFTQKHYRTGNMQQLQKEVAAQDIVWLSVVSSAPGKQGHVTPEQANELTKSRQAAPTAVLLDSDGTIGRLYGARTTPHMYVIDPEGTLVYMGGIDDKPTADSADIEGAKNYVRVALNALSEGQPVESAVTRPYGCSVKY
ncbi:MAG: thioredoxin family protein [Candidatus Competibacteraceae bacterium]|jgi:peroxiredoxin|nr:thioredoxin family protein [Candidatus Competibacteraceae bacterium]